VVGKIASSRGKSYARVALAWVKAQPGITSPIIAARTLEQLKDNLGLVGWEPTAEELEALDKVNWRRAILINIKENMDVNKAKPCINDSKRR